CVKGGAGGLYSINWIGDYW
nr:immunoglobulin heavy chain junction region [Macaca mulatta]